MSERRGAVSQEVLPRRWLGRSRVMVTEVSFGGAAIGNLFSEVSEPVARAAVDAAWDGGIRTFDTAPHYGLGLSERRLGDALRHRPREEYVISTKVGRPAIGAKVASRSDAERAEMSGGTATRAYQIRGGEASWH